MLVGIDIGGTKTAVVLSASVPDIVWREEFPTLPAQGPKHAVETIIALVRKAMQQAKEPVRAIGVSCGGPLDRDAGTIQSPPNLPTWKNVEIVRILREEFGLPCALENDANAGAIAEHRYGAGRGCRHMVFLTMGTGLGAGLILNGEIFHGASNMAGEIGHVRLTTDGPMGYNKIGSVEGWASGGGMALHAAETIRKAQMAGEVTSLTNVLERLTARHIGEALVAGDAVAQRIIETTGQKLGNACAILVDILNPERVVVGGLALRLGDALLQPARQRMHEEALEASSSICEIVPAALGERIGDVAALCIAEQALSN